MDIKQAQPSDIDTLVALWAQLDAALPAHPLHFCANERATFHHSLAQQITSSHSAVALLLEDDGKPVGTVCGHIHTNPQFTLSPVGIIYNLWVDTAYQKQGHGMALVKQVEQVLKTRGAKSLQVAWRHQHTAAAFWQKAGYTPLETVACKTDEAP